MKKLLLALIILAFSVPAFAGDPVCTEYKATLPYVVCDGTWWTGLAITNQYDVEGCLYIRYPNTAWKCHKINARGTTLLVLNCPGATYAELKSSIPLTIFLAMSDNNIAFDYMTELELCDDED